MHLDPSWRKNRMKTLMQTFNKIMKAFIERKLAIKINLSKIFELIAKK